MDWTYGTLGTEKITGTETRGQIEHDRYELKKLVEFYQKRSSQPSRIRDLIVYEFYLGVEVYGKRRDDIKRTILREQ